MADWIFLGIVVAVFVVVIAWARRRQRFHGGFRRFDQTLQDMAKSGVGPRGMPSRVGPTTGLMGLRALRHVPGQDTAASRWGRCPVTGMAAHGQRADATMPHN